MRRSGWQWNFREIRALTGQCRNLFEAIAPSRHADREARDVRNGKKLQEFSRLAEARSFPGGIPPSTTLENHGHGALTKV
jgi:hypothetical protein